jgi:hypothetical protein
MWSAFLTGAANQATEMIQKRDKDIQDMVETQLAQMYKRAMEAKSEKETRVTELTELRNALESAGFKGQEVTFLLQNKSAATNAIKLIETRKAKGREVTRAHLDSLLAGEMPKISKLGMPEEFITQQTTLEEEPSILDFEMKGAFGLSGASAREAAERRISGQTGMTAAELRRTKLPKAAMQPASLDYSMFAEPESDTDLKDQIRDIIARSDKTEDGIVSFKNETDQKEFDSISKRLAASAIVKAQFDFEEKKPRTASQIRSIFKDSIQAGLSPSVISGVAQVTASGDVVPITGDPNDISKFMQTRNRIIRDVATNRGLIDPRTGEVINQEAEDALTPYANIENGKIIGWKSSVPGAASAKPIKLTDAQIDNITTDVNDRKALKFVRDKPNSPEAAGILSVLRTKYKDKLDGI